MKTLLLLFVFLFTTSVNSQNCNVKSFKKKRDVKKIIKLIDNKNYNEAKDIIKGSKEHAVFNALRAEAQNLIYLNKIFNFFPLLKKYNNNFLIIQFIENDSNKPNKTNQDFLKSLIKIHSISNKF